MNGTPTLRQFIMSLESTRPRSWRRRFSMSRRHISCTQNSSRARHCCSTARCCDTASNKQKMSD